MTRAFARPVRLIGAALLALALAGCGGSGSEAPTPSNFKPVPVTPVIGDVVLGNPDSKVTLIEYAALTCPHCRDFAKQVYPRLKATYIDTGKIKYIYRDFPLEVGPDGRAGDGFGVILASVARCKGSDKFYEMIDAIFGSQMDLMVAANRGEALQPLADLAAKHGITTDEMRTCVDYQPDLRASIKKSRNDATDTYKISGTPSIILNEQRVENYTWEGLSAALDAVLAGKPMPTMTATEGAAPTSPSTPATPPTQ